MGTRMTKNFRSRIRAKLSSFRMRIGSQKDHRSEDSVRPETHIVQKESWSLQTNFRSSLRLSGSSKIYIWFESIQETGIRFLLDMQTGVVSDLENWKEDVEMPGGSAIDPEPLSVWGIDSLDGRINIIMNVDRFDDLFIDGEPKDIKHSTPVSAIVDTVRNVVVRDIWLEIFEHAKSASGG